MPVDQCAEMGEASGVVRAVIRDLASPVQNAGQNGVSMDLAGGEAWGIEMAAIILLASPVQNAESGTLRMWGLVYKM